MRDINILKNTNFFSSLSPTLKDGRKIPARDHPQWLFHLPRLFFFFIYLPSPSSLKRKMRRPSSIGKEKEPKFFRRLCWPHRIQVIKNFRSRRLPFESAVHKTRTVATTAIKASGTGQKCFTCSTQHFLMSSYLFIPPAA